MRDPFDLDLSRHPRLIAVLLYGFEAGAILNFLLGVLTADLWLSLSGVLLFQVSVYYHMARNFARNFGRLVDELNAELAHLRRSLHNSS